MALERPGLRPIRRSTGIPKAGANPTETKRLRQQADEIYRAAMGDLARKRFKIPTDRQQITFRTYREWYADHVSVHKRGEARERSMLRQLGAYLDRFRLDQITRETALEWRTRRRKEVSPGTVNREQEILIHMLNVAVPTYLEVNPLHGLERLRVQRKDVRILTHEEEARVLSHLTPEDQALVIAALDTCARLTDVVNLSRSQDYGTYFSFTDPKTEAYKVTVSQRLRQRLDNLPVVDGEDRYFAHHHKGDGPRSAQQSAVRMFLSACRTRT